MSVVQEDVVSIAPESEIRAVRLSPLRYAIWRSRSGRSYPTSVYPIEEACIFDDAVFILRGNSAIIVATTEDLAPSARTYASLAQDTDAGEIHVHLLATTPGERRSAASELRNFATLTAFLDIVADDGADAYERAAPSDGKSAGSAREVSAGVASRRL